MAACPTVKIQTPAGPVVINQSDYDPSTHKLYRERVAPPPEEPADEAVDEGSGELAAEIEDEESDEDEAVDE